MSYVIGVNYGEFVRVKVVQCMDEKDVSEHVALIEHGLNLTEKPDIYNDEEKARKVLELIKNQKTEIVCKNKNILGQVLDGDDLDISKLKLYKIILFDAEKDLEKQMRDMLN